MYIDGRFGVFALSKASNHGVPSENIGAVDLLEDIVGVGHRCGEGDKSEEQMFAHVWVVERNAMPD